MYEGLQHRTVYYPNMVVNFQIRFDEGLTVQFQPKTPQELSEAGGVATPATQPLIISASGKDNLSQVVGIVPKSCSVELPGYRQAGTFNITLEYKDMPLDPRIIRAIGVAIHLGAVPAADFAMGMTETTEGRRKSILTTTPTNLLIAGTADGINVEHGRGGSFVHIEGRDLRGILLDTKIPANLFKSINLLLPIDEVVKALVNGLHPQGTGIKVETNAMEWPQGVAPSPGVVGDLTRPNMDSQGLQQKASSRGEASQTSFWDIITQWCFLVGAVPYFAGSVLRIRPARSLFDAKRQEQTFDPTVLTPFKDGLPRTAAYPLVSSPEQFAYRRLVFGSDIEAWKFERKLGGVKTPVIECVAVDENQKGKQKLISAQHPPKTQTAARTTSVGPSGQTSQTDVLRIPVHGIKSKKRLQQIAEDLYEEIGRGEMGGSVSTKSLASFGGDNQDPDLLGLRPGDPVEFRVTATGLSSFPPPISELTEHEGRSFEEEVLAVKKRLGDENLARALVASNRDQIVQLQRTFRTCNVKYDWDAGSGVSLAFDFQNYVEARSAVTPG